MRSVLENESALSTIKQMLFGKKPKSKVKTVSGDTLTGVNYLGSISKYSKGMIMSFPLLCDASLPLDTIMMVSKANERNIVNMLQILFSSMNLATNTGDGRDIIAAVYKDLDPNMTYNDFIDLLDRYTNYDNSGFAQAAKMESALLKEAFEEWKQQKPFKKDSLNEHSVNVYCVKSVYGKTIVTEAPTYDDPYRDENQGYRRNQEQRDQTKEKREQEREAREKNRYTNDRDKLQRDLDDKYNKLLQNRFAMQDIKKANDLEPTLMIINYNTVEFGKNPDGTTKINKVLDRKSFVAGVKSRAVPVESLDIVERFVSKDKTKLSLKNLIRATTGEISLFKDFILCLDKLKLDARNAAKSGPLAQYWNILEKRSIKNNVNKLKREGNDGSAITTIVISQDAVNYMKSAYKFDLENITSAKMIMDSYNLLGLMIADEATESVKILYDGYNEFELASYRALDRDASDKEYKKMVNLINSQGR